MLQYALTVISLAAKREDDRVLLLAPHIDHTAPALPVCGVRCVLHRLTITAGSDLRPKSSDSLPSSLDDTTVAVASQFCAWPCTMKNSYFLLVNERGIRCVLSSSIVSLSFGEMCCCEICCCCDEPSESSCCSIGSDVEGNVGLFLDAELLSVRVSLSIPLLLFLVVACFLISSAGNGTGRNARMLHV
jgi:hypothetical protein